MRHQLAVEFDVVAGVDGLLPVERLAIGVFGDGDLGQKRFRRNASFNDMGRGRRLDYAVRVLEGILGTARDDHTELRRHHIQTLRHVLADQHLLLTGMLSQLFRLNDSFDPFQMGRKALAPTRCTLAVRLLTALADLGLDRSDAGLDFLEDEGLLFIIAVRGAGLFRSSAEPGAVEGLQDLRQPLDARIGIGVARLEIGDLALQSIGAGRLLGHGKHHGLQRLYVIREAKIGRRH